MKVSEMNGNQRMVFGLVVDACNEYFGGYENTLMDWDEDSEYYKDAVSALTMDVPSICNEIETWVRMTNEWQRVEHMHFVGLDWLRERIARRVPKMLAETKENFPEIFA